jgi:hypothetical protein
LLEVAEEKTIAGAEVVGTLDRGVKRKAPVNTVFRTTAETQVGYVAMQTDARQTVELVFTKPTIGLHHLS